MENHLERLANFTVQENGGSSYGASVFYNTEFNLGFLPGEEGLPPKSEILFSSSRLGKGSPLEAPTPSLIHSAEVAMSQDLHRGRTLLVIEDRLHRYDTACDNSVCYGENEDQFIDERQIRVHTLRTQLTPCSVYSGFSGLCTRLGFSGPIIYGFRPLEPLDPTGVRTFEDLIDPLTGFPYKEKRLRDELKIFEEHPEIAIQLERQRNLKKALEGELQELIRVKQESVDPIILMPPGVMYIVRIPFKVRELVAPQLGISLPTVLAFFPVSKDTTESPLEK